MPLTIEQRTELDALRAKAGGGDIGLNPQQTNELRLLRAKQQGQVVTSELIPEETLQQEQVILNGFI